MTYLDFKFAPTTTKWEMLLARMLGEKVVGKDFGRDGVTTVTAYHWRGRTYIIAEHSPNMTGLARDHRS